jgi:hypothetical protein
MGMGSQCGFLLRVCVGRASADVMGMLREIVGTVGMVMLGKAADAVSESSDGSSWGYGTATATAARALSIIARRMVGVVVATTRDDEFTMRLAFSNVRTDAVVLSFCMSHFSHKGRVVPVYLYSAPDVHIAIRPSLVKPSPGNLLGSTMAVFKVWLPSSICYRDAALVYPAGYV